MPNAERRFGLSLRLLSASAPCLPAPGLVSRRRPRVQALLGDARRDSEPGEYVEHAGAPSSGEAGPRGPDWPWEFGDTLSFRVAPEDLAGPGLVLRMHAQNGVHVGPLSLELPGSARVEVLGETAVDLRYRALPSCVGRKRGSGRAADGLWESPALLLPLYPAAGSGNGAAPTAHLAVVVSVDADPERVLASLGPEAGKRRGGGEWDAGEGFLDWRGLLKGTVLDKTWVEALRQGCFTCTRDGTRRPEKCHEETLERRGAPTARGATARSGAAASPREPLSSPETSPRDWACHRATGSERACWHHGSLGAGFWEREEGCSPQSSPREPFAKAPDQAPEGWISRRGPDGRVFWHHTSLGPAPWERSLPELMQAEDQAAYARSLMGRSAALNEAGRAPRRQPWSLPPRPADCSRSRG